MQPITQQDHVDYKFNSVCGKPWEKVSPILVTLTSRSDSNFERSNMSLKDNNRDCVDSNSNGFDYSVRKNKGKFYGFRQTEL